MPENKAENINDLLKAAQVPTVAAPVKAKLPEGAFTSAQDGKTLYRYEIDGETVVLPKPIDKMTEQDFYNLPVSLFDTQPGRLPQNLTVKFKDPQWGGYWFNKTSGSGTRVSVARSLGYTPANKDDLEWYCLELNDADGAVEQGDLVLMKIHKAKLYMQYKQAIDLAKIKGSKERYKSDAENFVRQAGGDLSKAGYFHTPQALQEFQGVGPVSDLPSVDRT